MPYVPITLVFTESVFEAAKVLRKLWRQGLGKWLHNAKKKKGFDFS